MQNMFRVDTVDQQATVLLGSIYKESSFYVQASYRAHGVEQ